MLKLPLWKTIFISFVCLLSIFFSLPNVLHIDKIKYLPNTAARLGLDLKGGASLVLEVNFAQYYTEMMQNISDSLRKILNESNIKIQHISPNISANKDIYNIRIELKKDKNNDEVGGNNNSIASEKLQEMHKIIANAINSADFSLIPDRSVIGAYTVAVGSSIIQEAKNNLLAQSIEIVNRRIDNAGTKEIDLQRQGSEKILLQVPGTYDTSEIGRLLGQTAKLTLHYITETTYSTGDMVPLGYKLLPIKISKSEISSNTNNEDDEEIESDNRREQKFFAVSIRPAMSGDMILDASPSMQDGQHIVNLKFTNIGSKIFADITSKNVGKILAIVLDDKIISAPYIREPILSGTCTISGNFTGASANELAVLLRAGALPAPLQIVEERTVGPTLGQDSIRSGTNAIIIASIAVVVFMIMFYGIWGVSANIALAFNILMIFSIFGILGATLTLPGLAGIALTLGMAVDANVLICERIREEYEKGITLLSAIDKGYRRSFTTIIDSNFTTIAAAVVLYIFGIGPIKGFAVSLIIGILCSIFTSVYITKLLVVVIYKIFKFKRLGL